MSKKLKYRSCGFWVSKKLKYRSFGFWVSKKLKYQRLAVTLEASMLRNACYASPPTPPRGAPAAATVIVSAIGPGIVPAKIPLEAPKQKSRFGPETDQFSLKMRAFEASMPQNSCYASPPTPPRGAPAAATVIVSTVAPGIVPAIIPLEAAKENNRVLDQKLINFH